MEQRLLLCGGPGPAVADVRSVSLDEFARSFGDDDEAWAALYCCHEFQKPVRFMFDDRVCYVAPFDQNVVGLNSRMAFNSNAIPLESIKRPDPPPKRITASEDLKDFRVWARLRPIVTATTIVKARSASGAMTEVTGNLNHYKYEFLETADAGWRSWAERPPADSFEVFMAEEVEE